MKKVFYAALAACFVVGCSWVSAQETRPASQPASAPATDSDRPVSKVRVGNGVTVTPVEIDPLGATEPVPWRVHAVTAPIFAAPVDGGEYLGDLAYGDHVLGGYFIVDDTDQEWIKTEFEGQTAWVSRTVLTRPHPKNLKMIEEHGNLLMGEEIVNRWWGIPIDYEADDIVALPQEYTRGSHDHQYRLRQPAAEAAMAMIDAAKNDGVRLIVSSPYRSGETQQRIYGRNVKRNPAQRSSAPPGHSEHQLATTIDFSGGSTRFEREDGSVRYRFLRNGDPEHDWLKVNGARFGFRQTYLADNTHETGYIEEPWHWRYMGTE